MFGPAVKQTQLCGAEQVGGSYISGDGLTLLYNTAIDGNGEGTLLVAKRSTRLDLFGVGSSLGFSGMNGYGVLSRDQLTIYFETTMGPSIQLRSATRASPAAAFGAPQMITELDTAGGNVDVSVSADEADAIFSSDRMGDMDLYRASRPCL